MSVSPEVVELVDKAAPGAPGAISIWLFLGAKILIDYLAKHPKVSFVRESEEIIRLKRVEEKIDRISKIEGAGS